MTILGVLLVVFVVLKLVGVIAWSWFWVLSPMLISIGLWALFTAGALAIFGITARRTVLSAASYRSVPRGYRKG